MRVELVGLEHRAVDGQHRHPPGSIGHRGPGARRRGLGVALIDLLDEHLVPEPAGLPSHRRVGGDDEDVVDAPAAGQFHDQVEE